MSPDSKPAPESPLLLHDRSLTGKVAQGSEAGDIVDQQLHLLGMQLVTQLTVLLRNVRSHGSANSALLRPLNAIRSLVRTLGYDQPVALRVHEGFLFLGERHLKISTQQMSIASGFMDALSGLGIGTLIFRPSETDQDLRRFAGAFVATAPGEAALESLRARLALEGVGTIELEAPRRVHKEASPPQGKSPATPGGRGQLKDHARDAYARAGSSLDGLNQHARAGGTIHFRQAKRAIQNIIDLLLKDPGTVLSLTTLRTHDEYTQNHSVNVALLSMALGNRAGYSRNDLSDLGLGALFHDLGKCAVPLEVLNKPGEFTAEEWAVMRTHPSEGVIQLLDARGFANVPVRMAAACFEHHLNFDLSGYPKLSQPWPQTLASRVIAIADCYDAMTSARVYRREPLSPPAVLRYMLDRAGTFFEPSLLKYFVTCIGIIPIGTLVLLDTGELAVVLRPALDRAHAERPFVRVICDAASTPLVPPLEVDLSDPDSSPPRTIVRLIDNTEYHLGTSRYVID